MKPVFHSLALALLLGFATGTSLYGDVLYFEDFESGSLAGYQGQGGGAHTGQIVTDPIEGDLALNFTGEASGGDIFTVPTFSHPSGVYILEFDYLGTAPFPSGGYIGVSQGLPGAHYWLAGYDFNLVDDGQWGHYQESITLPPSTPVHVMIEDFVFGQGTQNTFFDNITLHGGSVEVEPPAPVPEPTSLAIWSLLGFAGAGYVWRRRSRQTPL